MVDFEVNRRIKKIIKEHYGMTPHAFSRKYKDNGAVKTSAIVRERNGVSNEMLELIIEAYPEINRTWVLTGEGEMIKGANNEADIIANPQIINVPLISKYAYAGYLVGFSDVDFIETLPTVPFIITDELRGIDYRAIEVRGDSMDDGSSDSIIEGDVLLCRLIDISDFAGWNDVHTRRYNYVLVCEDGIVVKRIISRDNKKRTITIHSLNDYYPDDTLRIDGLREVMSVVQIMRKPKM